MYRAEARQPTELPAGSMCCRAAPRPGSFSKCFYNSQRTAPRPGGGSRKILGSPDINPLVRGCIQQSGHALPGGLRSLNSCWRCPVGSGCGA
jgi:hypothetical protein